MALVICSSLLLQIVFQTKMARTRQKRDIPVQKVSAGASVPPEKKYKNAILAEIVREIEDATLKASNFYGIQRHIIEQHKKDFPWLNKNNVDYFRRANLPAVVDDDEERNGGGENNGERENNGDAAGE